MNHQYSSISLVAADRVVARRLRVFWEEISRQARTRDFYIEWSCTVLSAFGAYTMAFGSGMQGQLAAWTAWLLANVFGAIFAWRARHYGQLVQFIIFMPSSLGGIMKLHPFG